MSNKLFNCFPRSLKLLDYIIEKEKNVEKYEVYAKFSRENEYQLVSTNTILYERIPSFDPLRQILKKYNLHEMIKTAYLNIDYDDYD